jgi:hypothetical protein
VGPEVVHHHPAGVPHHLPVMWVASALGMVERVMLPSLFARWSQYSTPLVGMAFSASGAAALLHELTGDRRRQELRAPLRAPDPPSTASA